MESRHGEDLGHGVYVAPGPAGELEVVSRRLDLSWRIGRGEAPGSAILWQDIPYEVSAKIPVGAGGARWILNRWTGAAAMRGVATLDRDSISEIADRTEAEQRARRNRGCAVLLLPLLGAAPAAFQKKWADEWNFAAEGATQVSAIASILVGALGLVQALALAFGSDWFLPFWLRWAVVVGPFLCCEGMLRLALVASDGEPVGSVFGLPLLPFAPEKRPEQESTVPHIRLFDESKGVLELESPIVRSDWDGDGLLSYRGRWYRIERTAQEGRIWVYTFTSTRDDNVGGRTLNLRPPRQQAWVGPHERSAPPSIIGTTFMTACMALAPRDDQELWGRQLDVAPHWFTIFGAGAELIGGVINIAGDRVSGSPVLIVLNLFLVGEGLLRFGAAVTGRPMGSIFGLLLRPLYRRWLPR